MARTQGPLMATVLLLTSLGLHRTSPLPACPESCSCQRAQLLNCSSSGLSLTPHPIQESVAELDLSHNYLDSVTLRPARPNLRNIWLANNGITHLSLCMGRIPRSRRVRGRPPQQPRPWGRRGCVSWAPSLRLLSAERNRLVRLPEGLNGSRSLQVLQLSFNRISTLHPEDLHGLRQLKELHLQHNLITSLQPQMIQDLAQLKVLDVSFNMLTSLQPSTYVPLRRVGTHVHLDGNRWQCDCRMRSLRRWMAFDGSRGLRPWRVVCASPSALSGADLLQVEEDDLHCLSTEKEPALHQDVTVSSGSEVLLSCSTKDSVWWTPGGQAPVNQPPPGLLISKVTETDAGPYVCVSEEDVSVFHVHVSQTEEITRRTLSVSASGRQIPQDPANRTGEGLSPRAAHSDLVLAVCLSVFITFLIAFILGVLARPCIDALCRRVTGKNRSPETHSASTAEPPQYDNEAFFDDEAPRETRARRERRVTFTSGDVKEGSGVQYYDTVAGGGQDSVSEIRDSVLQQSRPEEKQPRTLEFEHIPQETRRSSLKSDSSLSDRELQEHEMSQRAQTTPTSHETLQQETDLSMAKEDSQISVEDSLLRTNDSNPTNTEISFDNEDQFEFSDSAQSPLATSSSRLDSYNNAKQVVASARTKRENTSSSSSFLSEDESGHDTVTADRHVQVVMKTQGASGCDAAAVTPDVPSRTGDGDDKPTRPQYRPGGGSSSSEGQVNSNNKQSARHNRKRIPRIPRRLAVKVRPPSSDSSDGEETTTQHSDRQQQRDVCRTRVPVTAPETLDVERVHHVNRRLDAGSQSPALCSSSASDSEEETTGHGKQQERVWTHTEHNPTTVTHTHTASPDPQTQWPLLDLDRTSSAKRRLDVKVQWSAAESSSRGDSEEETTGHMDEQRRGSVDTSALWSHESHASWPELNLEQVPHTKRRLDFKVAPPPADSFSRTDILEESMAQEESMSRLHAENSHPALEHLPRVTRRLDIRARAPASDSSLSSDSEEEPTRHEDILEQRRTDMTQHPPTTDSHEPPSQWPLLDLEHTIHIRRRLDFKARSRPSDSSSDSEDETNGRMEEMEHVEHHPPEHDDGQTQWPRLDLQRIPQVRRRLEVRVPSPAPWSSPSSDDGEETTGGMKEQHQQEAFQEQTVNPDNGTHWPLLDLEQRTLVRRRLDIKAMSQRASADSSSSGEDGTTGHTRQPEIERGPMVASETQSDDAQTQWPRLDFQNIPRVQRRLDVKAQSPASDSSSEEEETTDVVKEQKQRLYQEPSPIHDPQTYWPLLDLQHTTSVKRHLDIKPRPPAPDSSSSGDGVNYTTRQERGETFAVDSDEGTRWPALSLDLIPRVQRRLDVKPRFPALESSSGSDSEDESINHVEQQRRGGVDTGSHAPDPRWPELDLERVCRIKRRLDVKVTSPPADLSSSSDSEDETRRQTTRELAETYTEHLLVHGSQTESRDLPTHWPLLDLQNTTRLRRRLDVKALSPASDSSSGSDGEDTTVNTREHKATGGDTAALSAQNMTTEDHDPSWPALNLEHVARIRRRLHFKTVSSAPETDVRMTNPHGGQLPRAEDPFSFNSDLEVSVTDSELTRESPVRHIPFSPKTDSNVTLETFSIFTENEGEINPELQSRWSTMDLGFSRYRKRQISSQESQTLPSSPPPDPPTSPSSTLELDGVMRDSGLSTADGITTPSNVLPGLGPLQVKRYLDVKISAKDQLTNSSPGGENESAVGRQPPHDESEATDHRAPDLSLGVPQVKRRLDIRAFQQPTDFLSYSEGENHLMKLSDRDQATDYDSQIQYKRAIFKASSLPSDSYSSWRTDASTDTMTETNGGADFTTSYGVGELQTVPAISTHDVGKKRWNPFRRPRDVGLPPELQWTGVGRNLSDRSIPVPRRRLHEGSSPPAESQHLAPLPGGESDDEMERESNVTTIQTYSPSPTPDTQALSLSSTDWSPATGGLGRRKGLSALKAMSSERLVWDTVDEDVEAAASRFTSSEDDVTSLTEQSRSETLLSSSTLRERRSTDLLSGFSRRTKYVTEDMEPPQHLPPPIPAAPPPDDEGLTWIV